MFRVYLTDKHGTSLIQLSVYLEEITTITSTTGLQPTLQLM